MTKVWSARQVNDELLMDYWGVVSENTGQTPLILCSGKGGPVFCYRQFGPDFGVSAASGGQTALPTPRKW